MIFVYDVGPASGSMSTSATPSTAETELTVRVGSAARAFITEIFLHGRGNALTTLSSIICRVKRFTTASSGGTSVTPQPRIAGSPAASATAATGATTITPGSGGGGVVKSLVCGGTSPDAWYAPEPKAAILVGDAGSGDSADFEVESATASMVHQVSCAIAE